MMIRHDDGHPLFLRQSDLRSGGDAVVAGEDRIDPRLIRLQDQVRVQPVAVLHPVRDRRIRISSRHLQALMQDTGGADTVRVIIADDADPLSLPDLLHQKSGRLLHAEKRLGRIHVPRRSIQESPEFLIPFKPPVSQDPRRHRADAEFPGYSVKIRLFCGYKPFRHISSRSVLP